MESVISYNGELNVCGGDLSAVLVDVFYPLLVLIKSIGGNTNNLDVALLKIGSTSGDFTKLSGTNRGEISGVREKYSPGVANPVMEFDRTSGGLSLEVGGNVS